MCFRAVVIYQLYLNIVCLCNGWWKFCCYKSGNSDEEINSAKNAIEILSSKIDDRKDFVLQVAILAEPY